jgi:hypothetical protein
MSERGGRLDWQSNLGGLARLPLQLVIKSWITEEQVKAEMAEIIPAKNAGIYKSSKQKQ